MSRARMTDPSRIEGGVTGTQARGRLLAGLPVTERRLRLNGVSTALLEAGEGPPVVLLHGFGEYAPRWSHAIKGLAATHRVIAPDLPGHGASDVIDRPPDTELVLGWLDDLIECACPSPPALVGRNLGGAIAARFAVERGNRLSKLVFSGTLGLTAFQPAPDLMQAMTDFLSNPTEETHDDLWRRCAFDLDSMRRRMGEEWTWVKAYDLDQARTPKFQAVQQGLLERFALPAIPPEDLARIAVPASLIWGRHDRAASLTTAEAAAARYGWPLHVIEDAAADAPIEQPEAFLVVLRRALEYPGGRAADSRSDSMRS